MHFSGCSERGCNISWRIPARNDRQVSSGGVRQQHSGKLKLKPTLKRTQSALQNGSHGQLSDIADFSAAEEQAESTNLVLPRPRRIILVRHGQSQGNLDENAYTRIPDSKIGLTEEGWNQAIECGRSIRKLVESSGAPDWKVFFYVSPYRRSLQTLTAIGRAFERERIAGVREEPRLREQDFGNFQDREKMRVEKQIRLRYGRFFYRFPNGESSADVYDRITGFRETLRADIDLGRFQRPGERSKDMNLIIVSHGLTLRVFLMRWYKWTVKQFEGLLNFGNAGTMVMQTGKGGRYSLLVHHTREELKAFGMTESMINDQEWQNNAKPGELNYDWLTAGCGFFNHFDCDGEDMELQKVPQEILDASNSDFFLPEHECHHESP